MDPESSNTKRIHDGIAPLQAQMGVVLPSRITTKAQAQLMPVIMTCNTTHPLERGSSSSPPVF
eukprot:1176913-Prorocentrum_minimum.AAC.4